MKPSWRGEIHDAYNVAPVETHPAGIGWVFESTQLSKPKEVRRGRWTPNRGPITRHGFQCVIALSNERLSIAYDISH
ncbi:hypothetical protein B0J17DRAFT_157135 [Rhizoctonia solani]|nr:hypothetical protein B0J17DRAFT_157135 [Rhizoctonia solani]